jgi:hypothetical protein
MRTSFLRIAATACVLAACSSKTAAPDGGPKIPGADAHDDLRHLDCGSNSTARGSFSWNDSSLPGVTMVGDGTATLRSEGGVARLELLGSHREGTVSGVTWSVAATLTGGETLLAGTYVCGQDAVASYMVTSLTNCWSSTPTADCPGPVTACKFTLDQQIWPGCFDAAAKGNFTLALTGTDADTVVISNGTFDVPIVEPLPPS